jgi:hypothetical protein
MGDYAQADRAALRKSSGDAGATAWARSETGAAAPLNARTQALLQLRDALDSSPRTLSQLALQRALDRRPAPTSAPADRKPSQTGAVVQRRKIDIPGLGTIDTEDFTERDLSKIIGRYLSGVTPEGQEVKNIDIIEQIFAAIEMGEIQTEPAPEPEYLRSGNEEFLHFRTAADVSVTFSEGMLADPETGKKLSKNRRRDVFGQVGIGEHLAAGHVDSDVATLTSQAINAPVLRKAGKKGPQGNFSWTSDAALLDAVQSAMLTFALRLEKGALNTNEDKTHKVRIPDGAGFGVVTATSGRTFRVWPRWARIVAMRDGDLKTAYGIAEEKNEDLFKAAYHRWELLEGAREGKKNEDEYTEPSTATAGSKGKEKQHEYLEPSKASTASKGTESIKPTRRKESITSSTAKTGSKGTEKEDEDTITSSKAKAGSKAGKKTGSDFSAKGRKGGRK